MRLRDCCSFFLDPASCKSDPEPGTAPKGAATTKLVDFSSLAGNTPVPIHIGQAGSHETDKRPPVGAKTTNYSSSSSPSSSASSKKLRGRWLLRVLVSAHLSSASHSISLLGTAGGLITQFCGFGHFAFSLGRSPDFNFPSARSENAVW